MSKTAVAAKADSGQWGRGSVPARIFPASFDGFLGAEMRVTDEDMKAALPEMLLTGEDIFTFPALVSNTGVDAYFTHMSPKTLANFARALQTGVAFLDSHNTGRLPVGYSYNGRVTPYIQADGREETGAMGLFYVNPGITFGAGHSYATTNDYIKAIRAAVIRDVSVGFFGGKWICDIDGEDYWGGACEHVAGLPYEVAPNTFRIATVTIDDADLTEVSAVYDGATPGATIQKVEQRWARGLIDAAEREAIQSRFAIPLPTAAYAVSTSGLILPNRSLTMKDEDRVLEDGTAGTDAAPAAVEATTEEVLVVDAVLLGEEDALEPGEADALLEEADETIRALKAAGNNGEYSRIEALRTLRSRYAEQTNNIRQLVQEVTDLRQQVAGLTPLAEDGRAYRQDLIDQTIEEGVRALGETFPADVYRELLVNSTIAHIKTVRESFQSNAAAVFPGGRQAPGATKKSGEPASTFKVPAEAYQ